MIHYHDALAALELVRAEHAWEAAAKREIVHLDHAESLRQQCEAAGHRDDDLFFRWMEAWQKVNGLRPDTEAAQLRHLEALRAAPPNLCPFVAAASLYGVGTA